MVLGVHHNDGAAVVAEAHIDCSRTADYCSRIAARMVEADYRQ